MICLKVGEHSSDSYIGPDDIFPFFFRKSLKFCLGSNSLFRDLTFNFFKFSKFPLLKRRQTPLSNSKSLKGTKKVIDF